MRSQANLIWRPCSGEQEQAPTSKIEVRTRSRRNKKGRPGARREIRRSPKKKKADIWGGIVEYSASKAVLDLRFVLQSPARPVDKPYKNL